MKRTWGFLWIGLLLFLVACSQDPGPDGGNGGDGGDGGGSTEEFAISLSENTLTLEPGGSGTVTVTVNRPEGFDESVTLSVEGVPPGVSAVVSQPDMDSQGSIQIQAQPSLQEGTYTLTIVASGGEEVARASLTLVVGSGSSGGGGGGSGDADISGIVQTDNAEIPLTPVSPTGVSAASVKPQTDKPAYVSGQLLVEYRTDTLATTAQDGGAYTQLAESVLADYGLSVLREGSPDMPALVALEPHQDVQDVAARLARDPRVAYAEPNYYIYTQAIPNDPQVDRLWNMPVSGLPLAWGLKNSAADVVVAVIDTGIALDHEDLQGIFVDSDINGGGYDFCATLNCASRDRNPRPDSAADRHGTHVTGTLAANGNNGIGVAGVVYGSSAVVPIKAFNDGATTALALSEAIRWAAGESVSGVPVNLNPADIINLSLGTSQQSATLQSAVQSAQSRGVLLIASAGNDGTEGAFYPARYSGVMGVGAVNSEFVRSCFSNFGSGLDIMAAGGDGFLGTADCSGRDNEAVWSTIPFDDYGIDAGTSMATPVVAGVAALVWSQIQNPTAAEVSRILKGTAYFDATYMNESRYGAGILRADAALGLPSPGDEVTVTATGQDVSDTSVDTVTLTLDGGSTPFAFDALEPGTYTLEADASGTRGSLSGRETVMLTDRENEEVVIEVRVVP